MVITFGSDRISDVGYPNNPGSTPGMTYDLFFNPLLSEGKRGKYDATKDALIFENWKM